MQRDALAVKVPILTHPTNKNLTIVIILEIRIGSEMHD